MSTGWFIELRLKKKTNKAFNHVKTSTLNQLGALTYYLKQCTICNTGPKATLHQMQCRTQCIAALNVTLHRMNVIPRRIRHLTKCNAAPDATPNRQTWKKLQAAVADVLSEISLFWGHFESNIPYFDWGWSKKSWRWHIEVGYRRFVEGGWRVVDWEFKMEERQSEFEDSIMLHQYLKHIFLVVILMIEIAIFF